MNYGDIVRMDVDHSWEVKRGRLNCVDSTLTVIIKKKIGQFDDMFKILDSLRKALNETK